MARVRSSEQGTFILACEHKVLFSYHPKVGESVWCTRCQKYEHISHTSEVVTVCNECNATKKLFNIQAARRWATKHANQRIHLVKIITTTLDYEEILPETIDVPFTLVV